MEDLISVTEAARRISSCRSLIQKRCADGTIPCIRVGKAYRLKVSDLEAWASYSPPKPPEFPCGDDLQAHIDGWLSYQEHVCGHSPATIRTNKGHLRIYIKRMTGLGINVSVPGVLSRQSLMAVFAIIPVKSASLKLNIHRALISLAKYLVLEQKITPASIEALRPLKPRRGLEPRRTHLKPVDVPRLFDIILTRPKSPIENAKMAAMAGIMVYAGLRVSEVCNLTRSAVDLEARVLYVRLGKGGKDRRVGINNALYGFLELYLRHHYGGPWMFPCSNGTAFKKDFLTKKMRDISTRLGVDITSHGLRRTFATLAANQGRSINSIRIALGHSNLETTQTYLRTSEAEVVEQMKDW